MRPMRYARRGATQSAMEGGGTGEPALTVPLDLTGKSKITKESLLARGVSVHEANSQRRRRRRSPRGRSPSCGGGPLPAIGTPRPPPSLRGLVSFRPIAIWREPASRSRLMPARERRRRPCFGASASLSTVEGL
jgi:hypothetical protein